MPLRCVGSKRTRELGRDMLLAASIVKSSVPKADGINRTVSALYLHKKPDEKRTAVKVSVVNCCKKLLAARDSTFSFANPHFN